MSRSFCTIDILPAQIPAVTIGISCRARCRFHQALGLHRITRRCPPGGSAASPRHQPAARACPAGTAADGRCETPLPPPRRAHSIPALHHVDRRDLAVGSNKDGDSYVATLIGLRRLLRIEGVLVPPLLQLPIQAAPLFASLARL